jgi:hypothetical protein
MLPGAAHEVHQWQPLPTAVAAAAGAAASACPAPQGPVHHAAQPMRAVQEAAAPSTCSPRCLQDDDVSTRSSIHHVATSSCMGAGPAAGQHGSSGAASMPAVAVGGKDAGQQHGPDDMDDGDTSSSEVDDEVWDTLPPLRSWGSGR